MEKEKLKNSYHRFSVTLHSFLVLFTSNIVITFMKGRTQIFVWMMMIIIIIIIIIMIIIIIVIIITTIIIIIIIIIIIVCRITVELT